MGDRVTTHFLRGTTAKVGEKTISHEEFVMI